MHTDDVSYAGAALDDAGSVAYAVASTNQFGTNPDHVPQIIRLDPATGAGSQITGYPSGVESVTVSDDGQWLAFLSCSNPVGSNHDGSVELFVMRSDGTEVTQLTDEPDEDVYRAAITGSGNRIVFVQDEDPLGTNPNHLYQLFSVNRDGTDLRQITSLATGPYSPMYFSVSDDGGRVVFSHNGNLTGGNPGGWTQIFAIEGNGANLRQLTSGAAHLNPPVISGNGATVAFSAYSAEQFFKIDWSGEGLLSLGSGRSPSITDDGLTILFSKSDPQLLESQIWRIGSDGTGATQLTSGAVPQNYGPAVSGDGSRLVFSIYDGQYPGGNNPDDGFELQAMDGSGGSLRQLTLLSGFGYTNEPEITQDGGRIFFVSSYDLVGTNADERSQIFRTEANGTGLAQVTNLSDRSIWQYAPSADGSFLVFSTYSYDVGCPFEIYKINADGTGLAQLTTFGCNGIPYSPATSGVWVVFQSGAIAGTNTDGSEELFRVRTNGTFLAPITTDGDDAYKIPRLSETNPQWVVYQSGSNQDGQNADGSLEIFRIQLSGTGLQRLTADPVYESTEPDVSSDGNRIVYTSQADPLGTNSEHYREIFLYDVGTATRRQLTFHSESYGPRISRDGAWVYFFTGSEPYRVSVASGVIERVGGTRCCKAGIDPGSFDLPNGISVDRTGTHAAFAPAGNWDHVNPDRGTDIYIVDMASPARIEVGKAAPTVVRWVSEPKPALYDVIRGNVANLGPGGSSVALGPVVCLEDDSPDQDTVGYADAVQPAAGQAFFFLYRGSQGTTPHGTDGPGSWGAGSGGKERVAGGGRCLP